MATLTRRATRADAGRVAASARAAYAKDVSRIGRQPAPMVADFAGHIAADHVVVVEAAGVVDGYMVAWAEIDAYFVHNIAVDPARQGRGLGRKLMAHAADEAKRRHLPAIRLYTKRGNDREFVDVRPHGIYRNTSRRGKGIRSGVYALDRPGRREMTRKARAV